MICNRVLRGLIELLILCLLSKGEAHGYKLLKELARLTGRTVSVGTLYPMLYRLEAEGLVRSFRVERDDGRTVRIYRITERGLRELERIRQVFSSQLRWLFEELLQHPSAAEAPESPTA